MRCAVSRIAYVGRATVFLVGLAVTMAVVVGLASSAISATGGSFILGKKNTSGKTTTLVKKKKGPALRLKVGKGQPPFAVSSSRKVARLNADRLDGVSAEGFYAAGSKVADSAHADNADTVGGKSASDLLPGGQLPSGRTLRGVYLIRFNPTVAGQQWGDPISFAYELSAAPTPHFIASGGPAVPECPGTAENPQANPGHLCVYEAVSAGTTGTFLCNPVQGTCNDGVTRFGGYVRTDATGTGAGTRTTGTWAVTAP